jgi:hypothetical protein
MRESLMYGSVRGTRGNSRPYRDGLPCCDRSQPLMALRRPAYCTTEGPLAGVLRTPDAGALSSPDPQLLTPC